MGVKLALGQAYLSCTATLAASCCEAYTVPLMSIAAEASDLSFPHRHLLGIEGLSRAEITGLLDLSEEATKLSRQVAKKRDDLRGRTLINLFFEVSTRTQASFELAGKRLGADVMNMNVSSSSMQKGETLVDTAMTLNAMRPLWRRMVSASSSACVGCSWLPSPALITEQSTFWDKSSTAPAA